VPWWPAYEGWLEKKSGGKDGESKMKLLQRWDKRYFVLLTSGTSISYVPPFGWNPLTMPHTPSEPHPPTLHGTPLS
jgi:hypothetical protein